MNAGGPVVAGWILEEQLGRGSFGEVWKAHRQYVEFHRALKLVRITDQEAFESWRHEIGRLEGLSHENIVRFYDADIVDEGPYQAHAWIATELCEYSLAKHLRERPGGVLSEPGVEALLVQILAALAAAESSGCVHRDVKPGNILWHHSGVWKLCDFGTARLVPNGATHVETRIVGTVPYMSPAAHHGHQDHYADLYALGVTIHEALCGRRLHPRTVGMTDSEYVKLVMDTPPTISDQLSGRWRRVVEVLAGLHGRYDAAQIRCWFVETRGLTLASLTGHPDLAAPVPDPTVPDVSASTQGPRTQSTLVGSSAPPVLPAPPAGSRPPVPWTPPAPLPASSAPRRPPPPVPVPTIWPPYPVDFPDAAAWGMTPPRPDSTSVVGRRLASFLLDGAIFWLIYLLLFVLALNLQYERAPFNPETDTPNPCTEFEDTYEECFTLGNTTYVTNDDPWLPALSLLVPVGLLLVEGLVGGSPGQLAVGLRTVQKDGRPAGIGRVLARWLLWIVDGAPYCFPLVGLIVALCSQRHQRVGDMVAGTYVVRRRDVGQPIGLAAYGRIGR